MALPGLSVFCALACLVWAGLAPTAAADGAGIPVAGTFEVGASNGYTVSVFARQSLGGAGEGQVVVVASRGGSSAQYMAPASVTPPPSMRSWAT
jgi:hypothetical protein